MNDYPQLLEYEFESLEEVRDFITHCPEHIKPILWHLYLATVEYAQETPHVH